MDGPGKFFSDSEVDDEETSGDTEVGRYLRACEKLKIPPCTKIQNSLSGYFQGVSVSNNFVAHDYCTMIVEVKQNGRCICNKQCRIIY